MDSTVVRDIMTAAPPSVVEDAGFREVVRTLVTHRVSALPVVDRDGRVVGVVSEEDLLHKEEFTGDDDYSPPLRARLRARLSGTDAHAERGEDKALANRADELMSHPAITVFPDTSAAQAARTMERHGVRQLPVVTDDERLAGMVTRRDLLLVFLRDDNDLAREVHAELVAAIRPVRGEPPALSVDDGVVTLWGTVERRSLAQTLIRRVSRLEGVVDVVSDLDWRIDDVVPEYVRWRGSSW
ncbi:CBS domain-containing protein [Thermobifida halotolerans]|uniref:CBS domain-containing protein n=1 Tax=Thermobifida halotolerans TaxID=483545 RepID=A0A399FWP2_9ACTN|nr:CBS domain-containing protein [Thermobifida halotolerans]UOE18903.1 CBS domain-containing protein [Thermobifida halotolerans]